MVRGWLCCGLVAVCMGCGTPLHPGATNVASSTNQVEITTIQPLRGLLPHRLQHLVLQR